MFRRPLSRPLIFLSIFTISICLDQVSKKYFAHITCNKGIAFGLNFGNIFLFYFILAIIFFLFLREKNNLSFAGLTLIFAGGMSNLFDRIVLGCVRDFISIYNLPVFNLADSVISVGVVALASSYFLITKKWK